MSGYDACGYNGVPVQVLTSEPACGIGQPPKGCQVRLPLVKSIAASASGTEVKVEPIRPGRLVKLIDEGSGSNISIDDIKINNRSIQVDYQLDGAAYAGAMYSAPLSTALHRDLYENRAQPLPPTGTVGRNNPMVFEVSNANSGAAENLQLGMYFKFN